MFRDTIEGLNNVFYNDIYRNAVVLVVGPPGCLKSGFSYSILSTHLQQADEFGVYMTLEETTESHLRNMQSQREAAESLAFLIFKEMYYAFDHFHKIGVLLVRFEAFTDVAVVRDK